MPIALMYHDVVPPGQDDASGFAGAAAARYKLSADEFRQHLDALAEKLATAPLVAHGARPLTAKTNWLLTFDDGGVSAVAPVADLLEAKGWRGHFFITTDRIDTTAFVTREHLQDLHRRGHAIGSHSCSHPPRMSSCVRDELLREWQESRAKLEDILGVEVKMASVPGGFYSRGVAVAAAQAGYEVLFNSEPTTSTHIVEDCLIVGRFAVRRGAAPRVAVALALGKTLPCLRQYVSWNVKKIAKAALGAFTR